MMRALRFAGGAGCQAAVVMTGLAAPEGPWSPARSQARRPSSPLQFNFFVLTRLATAAMVQLPRQEQSLTRSVPA
jgi:hypothetical protein